jgi:hypothetical protein
MTVISTSQVSQVAGGLNSLVTYECIFTGAANGASGVVLSPIGPMAIAADKVFLSVGGSAAATSAVMTNAVATKLVKVPTIDDTNQVVLGALATLQTSHKNEVTGLVNYFASAVNAADAAHCINFAMAGIQVKSVVAVELVKVSVAASGASAGDATSQHLFNLGSNAVVIPEPVTLGSNSKIIKSGTSEIALGTDLICVVPGDGLVFGTIKVGTIANFVLAAGDEVILRVKVLN